MNLDLRVPIGLMLLAFGVLLAGDGLLRGALVLGLNVNLIWGIVMAVCGGLALAFTRIRAPRTSVNRTNAGRRA